MADMDGDVTIKTEIEKVLDTGAEASGVTDVAEEKKEESPSVEEEAAEAAESETSSEEKRFVPDDALIERAVKAGLSVSDAKEFTSAEMAERFIGKLEESAGTKTKADGQKEDEGEGSPADEIPDLADDGDYDPQIVQLFKVMKSVIGRQSKELASLKSAGEAAAKQSYFDSKFDGLDQGVRSHVDAAKRSQLKAKFDMLEAGYKAVNAKVDRDAVFNEAVSLAIGDIVQKAKSDSKADALSKRKSLALARPGGESGQKNGAANADNEIAAFLSSKYNLK